MKVIYLKLKNIKWLFYTYRKYKFGCIKCIKYHYIWVDSSSAVKGAY